MESGWYLLDNVFEAWALFNLGLSVKQYHYLPWDFFQCSWSIRIRKTLLCFSSLFFFLLALSFALSASLCLTLAFLSLSRVKCFSHSVPTCICRHHISHLLFSSQIFVFDINMNEPCVSPLGFTVLSGENRHLAFSPLSSHTDSCILHAHPVQL